MKFLQLAQKALRLGILRIGPGWMFGLLTFNFNRITVHEMGAMALIVATLIGLHHFISPLQVVWGHLSDRYPLFGYRRTPYVLLSGLVAAAIFVLLPWLALALGNSQQAAAWFADTPPDGLTAAALALGQTPWLATLLAFLLLAIFGVAMAANGNSAAALVAETIEEKHRGTVFVVVWMTMIFTSIASAAFTKVFMPEYNPQQMQFLYSLTIPIILVSSVIGLVGMERRISREEHATLMERSRIESSSANPFEIFLHLLKSNAHVRRFFFFVLLAIFGIFLQDAILEIFGAEVFHMTPGETAGFTQSWGTGMLIGIALIAVLANIQSIPRKTIATIGGLGIAFSLGLIALAALMVKATLVTPALLLMGVSTGLFNVGALSLMMDMTIEGHAGLYMGMWGLAQGFGNGLANAISGALHTLLIETGLLIPSTAYGLIYSSEALIMVMAVVLLRGISVEQFKGLETTDLQTVMAFDTAA
jgi:MFS transporter, BCD family, chlorophyll transporter